MRLVGQPMRAVFEATAGAPPLPTVGSHVFGLLATAFDGTVLDLAANAVRARFRMTAACLLWTEVKAGQAARLWLRSCSGSVVGAGGAAAAGTSTASSPVPRAQAGGRSGSAGRDRVRAQERISWNELPAELLPE